MYLGKVSFKNYLDNIFLQCKYLLFRRQVVHDYFNVMILTREFIINFWNSAYHRRTMGSNINSSFLILPNKAYILLCRIDRLDNLLCVGKKIYS